MNTGIYAIVNTTNGNRYIGSAVDFRQRWAEHRSLLKRGVHNKHLQAAWAKYGAAAFEFKKLLVCSPQNLLLFEQRAIDGLRPEYNICAVAGNTLGTHRSAETRAKIAAKAIGRRWGDEAKEKLSASLTGRTLSPEHRATLVGNQHAAGTKHSAERKAAISAFMTGRPRPKSPEHRAKLAAALRGRKATAEHRANQSAAQLGKKRGPYKLKRKGAESC